MKLKVMTFNLRYPNPGDGINRFENRVGRILSVIAAEAPDLIGFQEATDESRRILGDALADRYLLLGGGRERDLHGEGCPIAVRREVCELVAFETVFLSDAPAVPGSRYEASDQSVCPRLFVRAELALADGRRFSFYNTHLDHAGKGARLLGMEAILQSVAAHSAPFVLTGDMNALPDSPEARLPLSLAGREVCDATAAIPHTFHDFGRRTSPCKIDYIYTDLPYEETYAVCDAGEDGVYISDHYPVCTTLLL